MRGDEVIEHLNGLITKHLRKHSWAINGDFYFISCCKKMSLYQRSKSFDIIVATCQSSSSHYNSLCLVYIYLLATIRVKFYKTTTISRTPECQNKISLMWLDNKSGIFGEFLI